MKIIPMFSSPSHKCGYRQTHKLQQDDLQSCTACHKPAMKKDYYKQTNRTTFRLPRPYLVMTINISDKGLLQPPLAQASSCYTMSHKESTPRTQCDSDEEQVNLIAQRHSKHMLGHSTKTFTLYSKTKWKTFRAHSQLIVPTSCNCLPCLKFVSSQNLFSEEMLCYSCYDETHRKAFLSHLFWHC